MSREFFYKGDSFKKFRNIHRFRKEKSVEEQNEEKFELC